MTLIEAKDQLVMLYMSKEDFMADLKKDIEVILTDLPEDIPSKKLTTLKKLAAQEAKGKFNALKGETEAMLELMEELEDTAVVMERENMDEVKYTMEEL